MDAGGEHIHERPEDASGSRAAEYFPKMESVFSFSFLFLLSQAEQFLPCSGGDVAGLGAC